MCTDTPETPSGRGGSVSSPWVDPYTDEVLARMRVQSALITIVEELRAMAGGAFIGSALDTDNNSVTVYWFGPRPAAANSVVAQALAAGVTVDLIEAPFSADELSRSRATISSRAEELGMSRIGHDTDGGGSTVSFRTAADLQAAKVALAQFEQRRDGIADPNSAVPAVAVLSAPPGSPAVRISDHLSNPQPWTR